MSTKPRERFLQSIRDGVPGTSMPDWGNVLSEEQQGSVLTYVTQTFTRDAGVVKSRNLPERNPVASSAESIARGERIFLQRCTGCHGRKADGKGPNSLDILPHPRNLRNSWFVGRLSDRRMMESILYGVQGTAMPPWIDFGYSQRDVGDIMNYVRSLNKELKPAESRLRPGMAAPLGRSNENGSD